MHSSVNPRHRQWPDDSDPSVSTVLGNNCVKKAHQVGYFLDESNGWSMDMDHLTERLETARSEGIHVNGFRFSVNPGGSRLAQVLPRQAMHNVVEFCASHQLCPAFR
jgi:hypothetical protein